jgi:hypothetical protein
MCHSPLRSETIPVLDSCLQGYRAYSISRVGSFDKGDSLKARVHLQFLLRFLVRFSPSDACERVGEL